MVAHHNVSVSEDAYQILRRMKDKLGLSSSEAILKLAVYKDKATPELMALEWSNFINTMTYWCGPDAADILKPMQAMFSGTVNHPQFKAAVIEYLTDIKTIEAKAYGTPIKEGDTKPE